MCTHSKPNSETCLTKNGKRALNLISFGTLRDKLQHCTHSPSITFLTPPSRLHEETATKSFKLKGFASLAERSRQGSRSLQVCWAALSCSDFHFIFINVSLILHWFSMICHWFCIDFHWFSIDLQWFYIDFQWIVIDCHCGCRNTACFKRKHRSL